MIAGFRSLIKGVGGAFTHQPDQLAGGLSAEGKRLIERAFEGIDSARLMDYHVHVVGIGTGDTGCFVNPHMQSWRHPISRAKFLVYASAAGITDFDRADQQFAQRLVSLGREVKGHGRFLVMAFDKHYRRDGTTDLGKTEFYVPNAYAVKLAGAHPDLFVPAASIHPYRKDALEKLTHWFKRGVRVVKWLPNAMGIDPADSRCEPFYRLMKAQGMVLLTHAGEEKAVEAEEDQKLGNPLRLRNPLDMGVKVIVSHCASLGKNEDLDDPDRPRLENFDLFMRLMSEKKYEGLLFGDISAMTQYNRLPRPVVTMLRRRDLHHRLVNGSDYPLPAINIIIRTKKLVESGLITEAERAPLSEIYDYNPLLFDFVVKRVIREPKTGGRFPARVFMIHPALDPTSLWEEGQGRRRR